MAKRMPKLEPAAPKRNLWFLLGSPILGLANNLFVEKYGNSVSDTIIYAIYAIAVVCFLIGIVRLERFSNNGGKVTQLAKEHPISLLIVSALLLAFLWNTGTTLVYRRHQKDKSKDTSFSTQPTSITSRPSPAPLATNPDPCPHGRTVLNHATADGSKLPPGVKSTGFFFKGDPCVTVTDSKAIGTTNGYEFDSGTSNRRKKVAERAPVVQTQAQITPSSSSHVRQEEPSSPRPTYEQKCEGGACAQGPGAQATYNQFGEPKREIESRYLIEITPILTADPGTASILSNSNSDELAQQLFKLFVDSGWKPIEIGAIMAGQSLPDGVVLIWRGPSGVPGTPAKVPDDRPDVKAIVDALRKSGIKKLTGAPDPTMPEHKISIRIGGIPQ